MGPNDSSSNPVGNAQQQSPLRGKGIYVLLGGIVIVLLLVVGVVAFTGKDATDNAKRSANNTETSTKTEKPQDDEALARSITPCALLTDSERATFGLATGEADDKHIRGCDWDRTGVLYMHVSIYPLNSLDEYEHEEVSTQSLTIGSHQASLIVPKPHSAVYGACELAIAIGPNKSASVHIGANGKFSDPPNPTKYCTIVKRLATYMEAKLP